MFYYIGHIAVYIAMVGLDSDFKHQIYTGRLFWPIVTILLSVVSTWLLKEVRKRPGYISFAKNHTEISQLPQTLEEYEKPIDDGREVFRGIEITPLKNMITTPDEEG